MNHYHSATKSIIKVINEYENVASQNPAKKNVRLWCVDAKMTESINTCDCTLTFAPCWTSILMTSSWPASDAMCSAVFPFCNRQRMSQLEQFNERIWDTNSYETVSGQTIIQ